MKKNIYLILAAFILSSCGAGKLVKTKKTYTFNYTIPPLIKGYENASRVAFLTFSRDGGTCVKEIRKRLHSSYGVVNSNASADLCFRIVCSERTLTFPKTETRTQQKTDKDGNPYTVTTVTKKGKYRFNVRLELLDQNRNLLRAIEKNSDAYVNERSSSLERVNNEYNREFLKVKKKELERSTRNAYNEIRDQFLKEAKRINVFAYSAKSKKHDYSDIDNAARSQEEWMNSLIKNEVNIDNPTIKELIEVYNEILSELNTHSSKARINKKIGAACYYNLGILYLSAGDKQKALDNVKKSSDLKYLNAAQRNISIDFNKIKDRTGF